MTNHHRKSHFMTWLILSPLAWLALIYLYFQRWSVQP